MSRVGTDSSIIRYNALGSVAGVDGSGGSVDRRLYIGGNIAAGTPGTLISTIGPGIVANYSSCRFLPGTRVKWTPTCSFNTSGRVYVGFTDNPEVMATLNGLISVYASGQTTAPAAFINYRNAVQALGSVISFPVWQETNVPFPTKMRRKRFDVNEVMDLSNADTLDRSCQTCMYAVITGVAPVGASVGQFEYHDIVDVEGIQGTTT